MALPPSYRHRQDPSSIPQNLTYRQSYTRSKISVNYQSRLLFFSPIPSTARVSGINRF
uniref:Uncharacterized protein n=1 Tax=Helianthus annuus TaxID=4232 RepID=A0A251T4T8_HELAN